MDVLNFNKEELIKNAGYICFADEFNHNFTELLEREDAKDIIDVNFRTFVLNSPDIFFDIINMKKYSHIFDDLIKKNIRLIIRNAIKQEKQEILFSFIPTYNDILIDNFDVVINNKPFFADDINKLGKIDVFNKGLIKYRDLFLNNLIEILSTDYKFNSYFQYHYALIAFLNYIEIIDDDILKETENKCVKVFELMTRKVKTEYINSNTEEPVILLNQISNMARRSNMLNSIVENNFEFIIAIFTDKGIDFLKREKIYDFYLQLFKDIINQENINLGKLSEEHEKIKSLSLKDIRYAKGHNSMVAIIGDKVIKNGQKFSKKIPYHKRFLQPVIRTEIDYIEEPKVKTNYKQYISFVEVYERVDTLNITEDDAYMIFKEMLYDNILWTDPNYENLGRLLKPNLPYVNNGNITKDGKVDKQNPYYVDDIAVGFTGNRKKEILGVGELVIPDVDCAYDYSHINLVDQIKKIMLADENIDPSVLILNLMMDYNQNQDMITGKHLDMYMSRFMEEIKPEIHHNKNRRHI